MKFPAETAYEEEMNMCSGAYSTSKTQDVAIACWEGHC